MRTSKEPGTEIAVRTPAAPASTMAFAEMQQLAEAIAKSKLFGITTPDQALVLMAISQAEGRHPALAARDYDIIQGRPAKKAEAMMRDFLAGGGAVKWHELTDSAADATFSHPQGGEARIKWDMTAARKAGLDGKENYRKFPRAMLRSRVVSEGVRTVWPMATSGFYVGEEVDISREPIDVTPAAELDAFAAGQPAAAREELRAVAYQMAARGIDEYREWWKTLSTADRAVIEPDLRKLREIAMAATDAAVAAQTPGAAPEPAPAEAAPTGKENPVTVDPPNSQPPQVSPVQAALSRYTSVQPPQVPVGPSGRYSFTDASGEVFEYESALDAADGLVVLLEAADDLSAIWQSAQTFRHAIVGNGNLLGEVDAAYARAAARVKAPEPNGLDEQARAVAAKGLKEFHRWWLRLEPAQRKELAGKRAEYEALAKESATAAEQAHAADKARLAELAKGRVA